MSQNSIKILKNQPIWKRKRYRFLLILIIIGLVLSCGLFLYYLGFDSRDSFSLESDSQHVQQAKESIKDLQGVELKSENTNSSSSFDQLFSKESSEHISSSITSSASRGSAIEVKIPKKLPIQVERPQQRTTNTQIPVIVKVAPSKQGMKSPSDPPKLNQPFKIDSIDAVILLELDMPVLQ